MNKPLNVTKLLGMTHSWLLVVTLTFLPFTRYSSYFGELGLDLCVYASGNIPNTNSSVDNQVNNEVRIFIFTSDG
jgi:hypothetical protein